MRGATAVLAIALAVPGARGEEPQESVDFRVDDEQMARFEPFLGVWGPPPGEPDEEGRRTVLRWGLPNKTVRFSEHRVLGGERVPVTEALVGYHYGRQRVVQLEFVRDGVNPFEVMNEGTWEFPGDGSLVRVFRSYDPDTSSREYRETTTLLPDGRRRLAIEYRDDAGVWQPFPRGPFITVRYPSLEADTPGDAGEASPATDLHGHEDPRHLRRGVQNATILEDLAR